MSDTKPRITRCATMEEHRDLLKRQKGYRLRRQLIERQIRAWERRYATEGLRSGVAVIPVVVHVVSNTTAQNISVAQVQSQIDVLNRDFRRLNPDVSIVPAAFAGLTADTRIEFALARRDPDCGATNGITRTTTAVTSFARTGNPVKFAASGGHDAWPADRYLNIWVCNLAGTLLGYAQFPGGPANTDGVVIDFQFFGTVGTAASPAADPFDLGRTATHEVGHWLDVYHIFGDDQDPVTGAWGCTGSDNVTDTPNQEDPNFGVPTFPAVSCMNGPDGDMFMNFMDYTDDAGMVMFSAGQSVRMNAALNTTRASLLGSSVLVPPPATGAAPDLWMADKPLDVGTEPDPIAGGMWESDDIWTRRQNDGMANQEHQNPEHRPPAEPENWVYVRCRNRGCGGTESGTLRLYWAKASSGLSWPSPWDGSITSPALMGGVIGSAPVTVAGGAFQIVAFPWRPPDPEDYASFGADSTHFCLLARIETAAASPFGMTFPETGDLNANVRNNNNIVWKNITVVDTTPGARMSAMLVNAPTAEDMKEGPARLVFDAPRRSRRRGPEATSAFTLARVIVDLGQELFERWRDGGAQGESIEHIDDTRLEILKPGAWIGDLKLQRGEYFTLRVLFEPRRQKIERNELAFLDVRQLLQQDGEWRPIGGMRFVYKSIRRPDKLQSLDLARAFDGADFVRPRFAHIPKAPEIPGATVEHARVPVTSGAEENGPRVT